MKIAPFILGLFAFTAAGLPLFSHAFGFGINSLPTRNFRNNSCQITQKDNYGRCPYTGRAAFRSTSLIRFSEDGSGGTTGGGGK